MEPQKLGPVAGNCENDTAVWVEVWSAFRFFFIFNKCFKTFFFLFALN